jgi:hypothetical protein
MRGPQPIRMGPGNDSVCVAANFVACGSAIAERLPRDDGRYAAIVDEVGADEFQFGVLP